MRYFANGSIYFIYMVTTQEVGGTLIGENGFVVMAGVELVEWYQIQQTHSFQVIDAIPFAPFQPLL
jgi:hypothetical protein